MAKSDQESPFKVTEEAKKRVRDKMKSIVENPNSILYKFPRFDGKEVHGPRKVQDPNKEEK